MYGSLLVEAMLVVAALSAAACGGTAAPDVVPSADTGVDVAAADADAQPLDAPMPDAATTDTTDVSDDLGDAPGDSCGPPIATDPNAVGRTCTGTMDCPSGYTCQPFSGAVLQLRCEILCTGSCDCPSGYGCEVVSDKGGSWMQCTMR